MVARSVSSYVSQFLVWAGQRLKPNTVKLYAHYLHLFCAQYGERPIDSIRRLDVELFAVKKHPLEIVRRFFVWLHVNAEAIAVNPCKGLEVPKSGRRSRVLDKRERILLRRAAGLELRRLLVALQETAGRPFELRSVCWEQIEASAGHSVNQVGLERGACFFALPSYKGQARRRNPFAKRIVPISPRLGRMLWRMRRGLKSVTGPVFTSSSGRGWTANALRCTWRRLCDRVRRRYGIDVTGLVPYLWRHTRATELALRGVNGRVLADLLGHSSLELLAWYVHPSTDDLCRVMGYQGEIARG